VQNGGLESQSPKSLPAFPRKPFELGQLPRYDCKVGSQGIEVGMLRVQCIEGMQSNQLFPHQAVMSEEVRLIFPIRDVQAFGVRSEISDILSIQRWSFVWWHVDKIKLVVF